MIKNILKYVKLNSLDTVKKALPLAFSLIPLKEYKELKILKTHEDNSYIVSAQNELNLKTPSQPIIQPKPRFINTSQVDETSMEFDQLTSVKETIST